MDYLAILKSMDTGKAETSSRQSAVAEPSYERNEFDEKGPVQQAEPAECGPQCPGSDKCAGCYSVGVLDGRERFIHPPRASAEWGAWLRRWRPTGRTQ